MVSVINIVNTALLKLGCDIINSLDQAGSKNAKVMNQVYDIARQELLRMHPWNFATRRATLASDATEPAFGYTYRYLLPSDCLRVIRLDDETIEYKIEGRYLLSDDVTVNLIYIADIVDAGSFDALFREALIWKLAANSVRILTGDSDKATLIEQQYAMAIRNAKQVDGQEDTASKLISDLWIGSRE